MAMAHWQFQLTHRKVDQKHASAVTANGLLPFRFEHEHEYE